MTALYIIKIINQKKLGILIARNKKLKTTGIFTDGDIKRTIQKNIDINKNKIKFAINSLVKAMKWDEDKYNLEYDLNIFKKDNSILIVTDKLEFLELLPNGNLIDLYSLSTNPLFSGISVFKTIRLKDGGFAIGTVGRGLMLIDKNGNLLDDFLILADKQVINLCNAPSPAATSCFAIGEMLGEQFEKIYT